MITRIATVAAISASLSMGAGVASAADETAHTLTAQAAHSHQHMPKAQGSGHKHDAVEGGPVQVEMTTQPEMLQAGERTELLFSLKRPSGQPLGELLAHHGRRLHVVIVSDDMDVLGHIHPEDFGDAVNGNTAKAFFTFPQPGAYLVAVDFMTDGGPQSEHFKVDVTGAAKPVKTEAGASTLSVPLEGEDRYVQGISFSAADQVQSYGVSLQQPDEIRAGETAEFAYHFTKDGKPLTELRPYLEAPLHLAVVKDDLTAFLHTHGTLPDVSHADHGSAHHGHETNETRAEAFGPEIAATVTFPEAGTYYMFAQAVHGEQLLISRVPVQVQEATHTEH